MNREEMIMETAKRIMIEEVVRYLTQKAAGHAIYAKQTNNEKHKWLAEAFTEAAIILTKEVFKHD